MSYTDAFRRKVVADVPEHGVGGAARLHHVDKGTVSRWCKATGATTLHQERVAAAVEAKKLDAEERRVRLADRLLEIAELGTEQTIAVLSEASLRDVVGAWTRAVHDYQLLSGGATGRTEHGSIDDQRAGYLDELAQRRAQSAA